MNLFIPELTLVVSQPCCGFLQTVLKISAVLRPLLRKYLPTCQAPTKERRTGWRMKDADLRLWREAMRCESLTLKSMVDIMSEDFAYSKSC